MTSPQQHNTSHDHITQAFKIHKPITPLHGPSAVINFGAFRALSQVREAPDA